MGLALSYVIYKVLDVNFAFGQDDTATAYFDEAFVVFSLDICQDDRRSVHFFTLNDFAVCLCIDDVI